MKRIAVAAALIVVAALGVFVWVPGLFAAQNTRLSLADQHFQVIRGDASSIGVSVRDVTPDDVAKAKLDGARGVLIETVYENTPASRAGFRSNDIVLEFDGERVRSVQQFTRLVQESASGRSVNAVVNRDGARQTLTVTPERGGATTALNDLISRRAERSAERFPNFNFNFDAFPPDIRTFVTPRQLGATVTPLSEQLETYFGVSNGVLVSSVESGSVASAAGLRAGDVITRVNGRQVNGAADVGDAVRNAGSGAEIEITVTRDKKELTLKARVPERGSSGRRGVAL